MSGRFISRIGNRSILACLLTITALNTALANPPDKETVAMAARARSGIVTIEARVGIPDSMGPFGKALEKRLSEGGGDSRDRWYLSLGSGVVWDANGHIVTTKSVVKSSQSIVVRSSQGDTFNATLIGSDDMTNLAVLSIGNELPKCFSPIAQRQRKLPEGSWLMMMGYGYGGLPTISPGMAGIPPEDFDASRHWFQFTAPLRPGNSGSALIDSEGCLAGIALGREEETGFNAVVRMLTAQTPQSLSASNPSTYSSLGVGIPINQMRPIIDQIIRTGRVVRGWIGVSVQNQNASESIEQGLRVVRIIPGSPAEHAGLQLGDHIVCLNGMDVTDPKDLGRMVRELVPGVRVPVDFIRDGNNLRTEVTILERPPQRDLLQGDEPSSDTLPTPEQSSR